MELKRWLVTRCLSCNVGELDLFGEPTDLKDNYCKDCRKYIKETV